MHITINRDDFIGAASRAASFTNRKNTIPILSYALVNVDAERATIAATDMERRIQEPFECEIHRMGSSCIPINPVLDVIKKFPRGSLVDISIDGETVVVKSGRYVTRMGTMPVEDFPAFSREDHSATVTIGADALKDALGSVMFAMSNEETRYYLNGVYIHQDGEKFKFLATDGHRLALARVSDLKVEGDLSKGIIVPRLMVSDLVKMLSGGDVVLKASERQITIQIGSAEISSKLVEGTFPDYNRVIPKHSKDKSFSINAGKLSEIIERVAAVSSEKSRPIKFQVGGNEIALTCADPMGNKAEDTVEAKTEGTVEIGFQARYVQDVMSSVKKDAVWHFGDSSAPCLIMDSGNADFRAVIMPMRC